MSRAVSVKITLIICGSFSEATLGGSESLVSNVTRRFAEHHSHQDNDDGGCVYQFEVMIEKSVWIKKV